MVLAIDANGGLIGKTAFTVLDILWFGFTCKAYVSARKRKFVAHKHYMIRSYALTFSAITLRTWNIFLSSSHILDAEQFYQLNAWMGFVPNLLVAEMIIRLKRQ